jgi:hypothetical protein
MTHTVYSGLDELEIHHKLESTNKHEKHSKATKAKE